MPQTVQLVLSTRTDPALPLGTLRARGQLLELRADDLRFTVAEATEFLNGRLGLGLSTPDVELLVARTEGGPVHYTLTAAEAVELLDLVRPRVTIPLHYEGWKHFKEGRDAVERELARAPAPVRDSVRWLPIGEAVTLTV